LTGAVSGGEEGLESQAKQNPPNARPDLERKLVPSDSDGSAV
jgi:hypothetical protein